MNLRLKWTTPTVKIPGVYDVAEIMGRFFPQYRAIAKAVWEGLDSPFPTGPYPKDTLRYKSSTVLEYSTPAHTEGLGTHSWLQKMAFPYLESQLLR